MEYWNLYTDAGQMIPMKCGRCGATVYVGRHEEYQPPKWLRCSSCQRWETENPEIIARENEKNDRECEARSIERHARWAREDAARARQDAERGAVITTVPSSDSDPRP